MTVSVSHQLVRFFTRRIKAKGVVHIIVDGEWHAGICSVDGAARRIHKMVHVVMPATFKDVRKTDNICIYVSKWIFERVAYSGLSG